MIDRPITNRFGKAEGLRILAATALLVIGATSIVACGDTVAQRPNVLIYVVDTLRADGLASYGNPEATTPNFDALAREGVVFENAYANASWTRASMASLMTGLLPWHHSAESRLDRLPETARTLAELFSEQGYSTALISANPNISNVFGFEQAFDEFSELFARAKPGLVLGYELVTPSDVVTQEIVRWLRADNEPFFIVALPIDPHYPYRPPRRFDTGKHRIGSVPQPRSPSDSDAVRQTPESRLRMRELYQGEVAFNDESFGKLVTSMKELGVWEDTIVVVTSDHGEEFWEYDGRGHGKTLTEEVLRVPLIIRYPKDRRLPAGARTSLRISLVDLLPTLLELAGVRIPEAIDGRDFFSSSLGTQPPVLAGLDLDGHQLRAAIADRYKLVWDLETDRRHLYDLQQGRPEARPLDAKTHPDTMRALSELTTALDRSLARTERTLRKSRAGPLPSDVEQSLEALGYIE